MKKLLIAALLSSTFFFSGCRTTFESDKTRLINFTFGFGFSIYSDKELKAESEPKKKTEITIKEEKESKNEK